LASPRRARTIEDRLAQRLSDPNIVYLLGAGCSSCAGLPGTVGLTQVVESELRGEAATVFQEVKRCLVVTGIEEPNIEEILSELQHRLDAKGTRRSRRDRYRHAHDAACRCIRNALLVDQSTEHHKGFIERLVSRRRAEPAPGAPPVRIFTTNYDLLIELACEECDVVFVNGFEGVFRRHWMPSCFEYDVGKQTLHAKTPRFEQSARHVRLFKLHGSLSWSDEKGVVCELEPSRASEGSPVIIYPSRLKYAASVVPPFDWLLLTFGGVLSTARVLVSVGYSYADANLNQYIYNGLDQGLHLVALSREPIGALADRAKNPQVSILNEEATIIDGVAQDRTINLWAFEEFCAWLPAVTRRKRP